ncbi:unnamed protein product, partial [marine sediment metagenome]
MKQEFIDWKPSNVSLQMLYQIDIILNEYAQRDLILTLRQLYYQLVARALLPPNWADKDTGSTNNPRSYKRLMHIVSQGRLAGLLDWNMIEDRGRKIERNDH